MEGRAASGFGKPPPPLWERPNVRLVCGVTTELENEVFRGAEKGSRFANKKKRKARVPSALGLCNPDPGPRWRCGLLEPPASCPATAAFTSCGSPGSRASLQPWGPFSSSSEIEGSRWLCFLGFAFLGCGFCLFVCALRVRERREREQEKDGSAVELGTFLGQELWSLAFPVRLRLQERGVPRLL